MTIMMGRSTIVLRGALETRDHTTSKSCRPHYLAQKQTAKSPQDERQKRRKVPKRRGVTPEASCRPSLPTSFDLAV